MKDIKFDGTSFNPKAASMMSEADFIAAHGHVWPVRPQAKREADLKQVYKLMGDALPKTEVAKPAAPPAPVKPTPNGNGNNSGGNA